MRRESARAVNPPPRSSICAFDDSFSHNAGQRMVPSFETFKKQCQHFRRYRNTSGLAGSRPFECNHRSPASNQLSRTALPPTAIRDMLTTIPPSGTTHQIKEI